MELDLTAVNAAALVPVIVALVQLFKMLTKNERVLKFAPLVSLAAGLILSFVVNNDKMDIDQMIMSGLLYGLGASGLYSGTKSTAHAIKNNGTENL
jgi:ethanolamine transporter EutH